MIVNSGSPQVRPLSFLASPSTSLHLRLAAPTRDDVGGLVGCTMASPCLAPFSQSYHLVSVTSIGKRLLSMTQVAALHETPKSTGSPAL
ncbi:hypothetical protein EI94DRAFT_1725582 [Lactarius quietus]|nr:hypothetical protein EI94DRAFT_1725582 [Lactarius quietus]